MGLTLLLDAPFFEGSSASSDIVPQLYDIAVAGIPFQIDRRMNGTQFQYRMETIDVLKPPSDQAGSPGEHSLSSDGLWRRAMETWHAGAGQSYFDRPDSSPARFRSSKGIDPWTRWQFNLLPATQEKHASASANLTLAVAGPRLYVADGQTIRYSTDITGGTPVWVDVTGTDASNIRALASDGFHVFAAYDNGIAMTDTSVSTATNAWSALVAESLGYHKGFLVASGSGVTAQKLYTINAAGTATELYAHLNDGFTWVGFADGKNAIYAAGFAGDKSLVYSIPFEADGVGLDVPKPAGELPDGEVIRSIQGYLGAVVLGTDKGVRFCTVEDSGSLTIGALIPTPAAVRAFEGQDRFIWFGWSNYDASSTGLGRLDPLTINPGLAPAYASDLMLDGQGEILSIASFQDLTVFSVANLGIYAETGAAVEQGTIDSGYITFGLPDLKTAVAVDVRHPILALDTSHEALVSVDDDTFTTLGLHSGTLVPGSSGEIWAANKRAGERIEVRHVLSRTNPSDASPVITRTTLKGMPRTTAQQRFTVPCVIAHQEQVNGQTIHRDPNATVRAVRALRDSQQVVAYQEFDETHLVVVDGFTFVRDSTSQTGKYPLGTLVLSLKTLDVEG